MKIAVITDLHYTKTKIKDCPNRAGELAKELLASAVDKINSSIKPDLVLGCGDFINDENEAELLKELAAIFEKLNCPKIIIPGNHDPSPEIFYKSFERPAEYLDINGYRIIPFPDNMQTAGYNARKSCEDIERIKKLSKEMPTILVQHVPLYAPRTIKCEYNYDNAEEIISACENVVLSISGHEHAGFLPSFRSKFPVVIAPALCEGRFPFAIIKLDGNRKIKSYHLEFLGE